MDDRRESEDKSMANIYGASTVSQVLRVSVFTKPRKIGIVISALEARKPRLREAEQLSKDHTAGVG